MPETIFFSWQLDTPTITGRNFVERALERAISRLNDEVELDEPEREELALDRDTKGVAGQPPIVETIFKKIDATAVFVPDLTFVGSRADGRPTPNPNVLIEYGWALKSLGHGRIVPVMNVAHGEPTGDSMPFDMRHLRFPITYNLPSDATEQVRKTQREVFVRELAEALGAVIAQHGSPSIREPELPFSAMESAAGPARFRPPGAPIGIRDIRVSAKDIGDVFVADGSAVWLRVMPVSRSGRTWNSIELKKVGVEGGLLLSPIVSSWSALSYVRGDDGFGTFSSGANSNRTDMLVYAFETGEVWAIDSSMIPRAKAFAEERRFAGVPILEEEFRQALSNYSQFLERLGMKRPHKWIAGLEGVRGCGLYYEPPPGRQFRLPGPFGACTADIISGEGILHEGEAVGHALKPFFVDAFAKFGLEREHYPADATPEDFAI